MKNKTKLFTLGMASLFAFSLTSCGEKEPSQNQKILNAFNNAVETAKTIEQDITISHNNLVYTTEEITINLETGEKNTSTKVANTLDSDEAWTVTNKTETVDVTNAKLDLNETMFSSITLNQLKLNAVVKNSDVYAVFGINANEINGDVSITFTLSSLDPVEIKSVEIEYVSTSGNDVEVVTSYTF